MEKKVALITGASAGMGKETAKLLLQNGYTVYAAARRTDKMKDLEQLGAHILSMDVTKDDSMISGIEAITAAQGRIDVLINNAGFGSYGALEDVPLSEAKYQLEVNVFGLARLTQLVLPLMRSQRSGKIVNITSIGGKLSNPFGGWYHASKFAVEALSDSLRIELKPFGIDVVIVEPGGVKSEWSGIAKEKLKQVSGSTAYSKAVGKMLISFDKFEDRGSEPMVIAKIILKAITARRPKIRYHGGFMAAPLLFMKKVLSDRMFDRIIMSQIK